SKVFDQYLRDNKIPVLEYKIEKKKLLYRWNNCLEGFAMPVKYKNEKGEWEKIQPTSDWKTLKTKKLKELEVDKNFYIDVKKVTS
ncbi:MAG: M1 family peptidase, partial [Runella zeae]